MKPLFILFIWWSAINSGFGQIYTVQDVPNVKLIDNNYVSDPGNILKPEITSSINKMLSDLEKQTTVQVAVVVLNSIGIADIFDFSQQLFNSWGIGKAGKDNGLLILLVVDQRTVRFHTGSGLEGVLPDVVCFRIQQEAMVPLFRVEDYSMGIAGGVEQVVRILTEPGYADELWDDSVREANGWDTFFWVALGVGAVTFLIWFFVLVNKKAFSDSKASAKIPYREMRLSRAEWAITFGVIPLGILLYFHLGTIVTGNHILLFLEVMYGYVILTLMYKRVRMGKVLSRFNQQKDFSGAARFLQEYQIRWLWSAIFFPLPLLFMYFEYRNRIRFFRNHPRNCKSCGTPMQKLNEQEDDQFIGEKGVFEEQLGSVDYDVWRCPGCQATQSFSFLNRFSKYKKCPGCGAYAQYVESRHTIVSPTYESSGTGQQTDKCKFCKKEVVTSYSIAKLTPPSNSSSSSGSGSSGSSGGSWGGGSSGGGGASSSW